MAEFKESNNEAVTETEMQAVYKKIATPYSKKMVYFICIS